ncbi:disease resistance protein RPV1-like [Prunus dulcis]|uniref:disease resistance protein RPV1-like n=1 Tax=Prunus dulcis TaxID=3755 RepID=UPI001482D535|nr:disease resistance protein RPV1-like [Prunus dulcis]
MAAALNPMLHDASSSSSYRCSYHSFLSFRGEDTRKGFTDHLYRALELAGIHTFRDDDEIERGADIAAELNKAINESKVSIIVFSQNYASSRWCLDELVKIMERRKHDDGHIVMPVFYHVDPSHVRNQRGSFTEAFSRHEERFKEEMNKVEEWRRALKDAADLAGMALKDRYESQFIQDIVKEIGNKLDPKVLNVAPYAVGIDDRVQGINMWLEDGSNAVGVAVIYGMGGIGKTTIAKAAYNRNFGRFQGSSFLADIREAAEQPYGFVRLQRKLLSDIQKGKAKKIDNIDEGIIKIKHAVCNKRLLIVLDDVNDMDQFNAILGMREWFYPGSKIIITTRHEHLLKAHEGCTMFEVGELNEYESLELFSWHAFGQPQPIEGYMELSRPAVEHCGGIPLALQVLGSSLSGKEVDVWHSALQKLCEIPNVKIQKILRISYDSLQDDHDQNIFLHIAYFFIGKEKDFTITILDNLNFYTRIGIQNLVDRCLVKINNEDNRLNMHHLLRDMGRGIVREESPQDPGRRSRVWHKDAFNILRKMTGTEMIKGLMLNLPKLMQDESCKTLFSRSNKKRSHVEDYDGSFSRRRRLDFFSWKSIASNFSSTNSAPASNEVDFKTEAFKRMNNLELLQLYNVKTSGGFEDFPKNLAWLAWRGFPLKSLPANFCLENLVVLDLRNSSLQHVWKGHRFLPRLKTLNLSHSHSLTTTPDMSGLPKLERLILKDCINLVEVNESIGDLENLVHLNLRDCKNLMKLPTSIRRLGSLQDLILSGCSKLKVHSNTNATNQVDSTVGAMKKFNLLSTKLWQSIESWILPRKNLVSFSLASLPHSIERLSLAHCNVAEIPSELGALSSLKHLDLSATPILNLPGNMKGLIMLQTLLVEGCAKLQALPELPASLNSLEAGHCTSLKKVTNLPNIFTSMSKNLWDCNELVEVESLFEMKPLRNVDIEMIKNLGLFNLESNETSEVEMINYLTNTTKKCRLQGLNECGIFSIFLHGNKIPDWFSYKSLCNSVLSIVVPSHPNLKIRGLNACILYARRPDHKDGPHMFSEHFVKVSNETKGLMWTYFPVAMGLPRENQDMLWLSHWVFRDNELESGDEIRVSVKSGLWAKEFGIQLLHEEENKGEDAGSKSEDIITLPWNQNVDVPVSVSASKYEMWRGKYFLCNHRYRTHQAQFRRCQENPAYGDFSYKPGASFHLNRSLFNHEVDIEENKMQFVRKALTD